MTRKILAAQFSNDLADRTDLTVEAFQKAGFSQDSVESQIYTRPSGYVTEELYQKGDITVRFLIMDPKSDETRQGRTMLFQYHVFKGPWEEEQQRRVSRSANATKQSKPDTPTLNKGTVPAPKKTVSSAPDNKVLENKVDQGDSLDPNEGLLREDEENGEENDVLPGQEALDL